MVNYFMKKNPANLPRENVLTTELELEDTGREDVATVTKYR